MLMFLLAIFVVSTIGLAIALFYAVRSLLQKNDTIIELEEQVELSLDVLDRCYRNISEILATPVAFDDPYIRNIVNNIKNARESVLMIAEKLSRPFTSNTDVEK